MTTVVTVAHTGITVRSLEAATAFWVQALGASVEREFALEGDFASDVTGVAGAQISAAVLLLGGHRIELLEYLQPTHREHLKPRPNDLGSWHLALEVTDLDLTAARCGAHDWRLAGAARTMTAGPRAGTRFAYLHDQDGATLELIEQPARDLSSSSDR
ncbi:MAG: VOC family protein [Nocardioidaceae bacterium]|nr:VOC family protein [Nocardioidaceae bacterium]